MKWKWSHGRMRRYSTALLILGSFLLTSCQPAVGVGPRFRPLPEVPTALAEEASVPLPSAEEGRKVFVLYCAFCHGNQGFGDGVAGRNLLAPHKNPFTDTMRLLGIKVTQPDLPSRPANFHNRVAMRLNSPFSMYETVTLGRAHTAMPAFGPRPAYGANDGLPDGRVARFLSDEERWHVIFYEWTFSTTPQTIAAGRALYEERQLEVRVEGLGPLRTTCAGCHGANGDGRGGEFSQAMGRAIWGWNLQQGPGIFTDRHFLTKRKPTELFARITDGHQLMPSFAGKLTIDEIWALVDYIWTFAYRYSPARGQQP